MAWGRSGLTFKKLGARGRYGGGAWQVEARQPIATFIQANWAATNKLRPKNTTGSGARTGARVMGQIKADLAISTWRQLARPS